MEPRINPRRYALSQFPKNGVGAEIGVHQGDFSQQILEIAKPKKLFLIDPWKYFTDPKHARSMYGGERASQEIMDERHASVAARMDQQIADGVVEIRRETSAAAAVRFPDQFFDFVYVDGDHTYEGVKEDLRLYMPKIRSGGLLIGDDYRDGWGVGVVKAFHELLADDSLIIEFKLGSQIGIRKR
jgi:hypothetical protein